MSYKNSKKYVPHTKLNEIYFELANFFWQRATSLQNDDSKTRDNYLALINPFIFIFDEYLPRSFMLDLSLSLDEVETRSETATKELHDLKEIYYEVFERKYAHKQEYFDLTRPDHEVAAFLLEKIEENYHNKFALEQLRNIAIWLRPVFDKKMPTGFSDAIIALFSLRRNNPAGWSAETERLRRVLSSS